MFELKQVSTTYQHHLLFQPITYTFTPQENILIQGANGIGKTTLLRSMLGLHPVAQGTLLFDQKPIQSYERYHIGQMIGYVHQQPSYQLFGMSVIQECVMFAKWRKQHPSDDVIKEVLERLDLYHVKDQHPQLCSRGEQQRLSLAVALLQQPRFILLDEPTTALDDQNVRLMVDIINSHREIGWIIVSHDKRLDAIPFDQIITLNKESLHETV